MHATFLLLALGALPDLDGLYLVGSRGGSIALELNGERAVSYQVRGRRWGASLQRDSHLLTLRLVGGLLRTTYAVVDGRLWINVMHRDPRSSRRWVSIDERENIWGELVPGDGPAEAVLDEEHGMFTSAGDYGWTVPPTRFSGRSPVEGGFVPAFESGEPYRGRLVSRVRPYRQVGDVILAPWSIPLGTPGLKPARVSPAALEGLWSESGEPVNAVRFTAEPALRPGRWTWGEQPSPPSVVHLEGDAGVFVVHWVGGHPPMNHLDVPSSTTYVALSDGRILQHVQPGGCNVAPPALAETFLRRARLRCR